MVKRLDGVARGTIWDELRSREMWENVSKNVPVDPCRQGSEKIRNKAPGICDRWRLRRLRRGCAGTNLPRAGDAYGPVTTLDEKGKTMTGGGQAISARGEGARTFSSKSAREDLPFVAKKKKRHLGARARGPNLSSQKNVALTFLRRNKFLAPWDQQEGKTGGCI